MPFETSWYVARRVVYEKIVGSISVQELNELVRQGAVYQEEAGDHAVHFIADLTELQSVPLNIVQLRSIELKPPQHRGMTVIVRSPNYRVNNVATFLAKLMRTVFGLRFKIFSTIEEAYAHLQEVDPSLRDLSPRTPEQSDDD